MILMPRSSHQSWVEREDRKPYRSLEPIKPDIQNRITYLKQVSNT
ncbi:hypothetical protein J2067_004829 [Erwinia rhapontici]|nr:hypothetical protein [Erwinia rhapontici]